MLQHEAHSKATPTACIVFHSLCNPCAVGTVSLGNFTCSVSPIYQGVAREEDQGEGPVAFNHSTRELPVLEACKPGDILKHTTYLGPWDLQGQFGNLSSL